MEIHKFTTEQQANEAIERINKGEGIPASPDSITTTYCMAEQLEDFWYIRADEVTRKYINEVTEIEA